MHLGFIAARVIIISVQQRSMSIQLRFISMRQIFRGILVLKNPLPQQLDIFYLISFFTRTCPSLYNVASTKLRKKGRKKSWESSSNGSNDTNYTEVNDTELVFEDLTDSSSIQGSSFQDLFKWMDSNFTQNQ